MWSVFATAASNWLRHRDARLGAALAYYSVFSLGPLLLIVVSVAGLFFGGEAVGSAITNQFRDLLGPLGSQAVEAMLKGAGSTGKGIFSAVVGAVLLAVAALGVVVQLKDHSTPSGKRANPRARASGGICALIWCLSQAYSASAFSLLSPS